MMNDPRMFILLATFYAGFETLHINVNHAIKLYNTVENVKTKYLVSMICSEYFNEYSVITTMAVYVYNLLFRIMDR